MSCYQCGAYGHKKERCPQRIKKIKCYLCNEYGHYKNNCPIILNKLVTDNELKIQQERALWIKEKLPDVHKIILNKDDIKNFLIEISLSEQNSGYWSSNYGCIYIVIKDKIHFTNSYKSYDKIIYALYDMTIDEFISFMELKGLTGTLWYNKVKIDLRCIIIELSKVNIIKTIQFNKITNYYIDDKHVMRYRNKENPDVDVYDEYKLLICKTYDNYKNDGRNTYEDIKKIELKINM
jgi:hypothetical protein